MDDSSKDGFQATPASTLEQQIMDACVPKNEREHWAAREITRLRAEVKRLTAAVNAANSQAEHFERQWYLRGDEVEALRGITPELPPRPPDGGGLPRYGLRHNGSAMPMSVPMADGYWTPYHLAIAEVEALRADAERYRWLRDGSNPPWVMQMLERYADNGSDFDAEVDAARAPQQAEPVAKIIRNDSGQVRMVDGSGEPFDMFAHVGQSYYAHPPAAEVQRLREALKPFAAIDLTTNQAVDAMDVLRARRALEGK